MFGKMYRLREPVKVGGNDQKGMHGTRKVQVPGLLERLTLPAHKVDDVLCLTTNVPQGGGMRCCRFHLQIRCKLWQEPCNPGSHASRGGGGGVKARSSRAPSQTGASAFSKSNVASVCCLCSGYGGNSGLGSLQYLCSPCTSPCDVPPSA